VGQFEHTVNMYFLYFLTFQCHFCTGAYSRPIKMYEHAIRTHILEVSRLWIKCSECYLHLPTQVSLVRHLKEDHSKKKSRTCKGKMCRRCGPITRASIEGICPLPRHRKIPVNVYAQSFKNFLLQRTVLKQGLKCRC
jgi:hypothetical protein